MNSNPTARLNLSKNGFPFAQVAPKFLTALAIILSLSVSATAEPIAQSERTAPANEQVSAIVYLPDDQFLELEPQEIIVAANQPVRDAVGKILQAYRGQDMGLEGYNVSINPSTQEAQINFEIDHPRGVEVFQSLSSANKYALFEAITRTLVSQPIYNINEVTFTANGTPIQF